MGDTEIKEEDADAMHVDMMAAHARRSEAVLKLAAPHLARLKRFIDRARPHEFLRLDELVAALLHAFPAGDAFEIDLRIALVVEILRLVRPDAPQQAASLLLSVMAAWPGVSWPAVYTAVHDASSPGFWAPVDLRATRPLPLSDLFVLATAVSAHLSMRFHQSIDRRQLTLPPDDAVVNCESTDPARVKSSSIPARLALDEDAAEEMLGSPEIAHLWAVLAHAGDERVVDAFASVFGGPDDGEDGGGTGAASAAVAAAVRRSIGVVTAPRFLLSVRSGGWGLGYSALSKSLRDVLLWPDIAKLAVLLHAKHPPCILSFMPLPQACERDVAPALLPTLKAMEREDFEANAAKEAAALRVRVCMPGKGSDEVDPRMYRDWAASTFDAGELFADTRLREVAARAASLNVHVLPIDVDNFPSFEQHTLSLHGEDHIVPHVHRGTPRDAAFFRQHLNFLRKHRRGTLSKDDVRNIMRWLDNQ